MTGAQQLFEVDGSLPTGRLAVEASAGTGKTYTLAALATRYVAERDVKAGELLVVTFTRAATHELRSRVRERFVEAAAHLASGVSETDDEVLAALADADATECDRRRRRLEEAVADFDAATITTIHGFAAQVLGTLGSTLGTDPDTVLVDDARDLAEGICADVLAGVAVEDRWTVDEHGADELPTLKRLVELTKAALSTPDLLLLPEPGDPAGISHHLLRELTLASVARIRAHRQRSGTRSFDDLLTELRRAVRDHESAAADILRSRFRVALIDEFQDTDPVQWEIFQTLFGRPDGVPAHGATGALVLVGDPKQAIYAFRGANIHTYVQALASQTETRSLGTNWRSDGAAIAALGRLFAGATFGDERIAFTEVRATKAHQDRRLAGADGRPLPALAVRLATGADIPRNEKDGFVATEEAVHAICADLAVEIRALFDHASLPVDDHAGTPPTRAVRPSDVAVLVRTGTEAQEVQRVLVAQGIPAVLARGGSVLASPAATQWRWLLEALARPSDPSRARTFALSWFTGWTAEEVAAATDHDLAGLQDRLQSWSEHLAIGGVNALVRRVWADSGVAARVLGRADGDRDLTDLGHLAELLRTDATGSRASVASLLAVLDTTPVTDAEADIDQDLASRRIETEAEAVQIMTVWVSKGLEFPIVCCPTLWRAPTSGETVYQDPERGVRVLDVAGGKEWPDKKGASARKRLADREAEGESLRLLYVALTRAKHQTILWWASTARGAVTGLAHVLFARMADGSIDPAGFADAKVALPGDDELLSNLAWLADGKVVTVTEHGRTPVRGSPWLPMISAGGPLVASTLGRVPDRSSNRWSFTAVTAAADIQPEVALRPDLETAPGGTDEGDQGPADDTDTTDQDHVTAGTAAPGSSDPSMEGLDAASVSPLASLRAGADFGVLVHAVLEHVDFTAPDLDATLDAEIGRQLGWRSFDLTPVGRPGATPAQGRTLLVDGLRAAIDTPLGAQFEGRRLRDLAPADRLDELSFEIRLGDRGRPPTDRDIGRLVLDHLTDSDPYRAWAAALAGGRFGVSLAGHLTGSIDVVCRVDTPDGPRFVIVDYKTNRLHDRAGVPRPDDYHPARLAEAMAHHHYPLQALLYSVAVHRYLRWRMPDSYDEHRHLGGAAYLFVRGMSGARVPVTDGAPHGVAAWPIPPGLVVGLSDLLDGRAIVGGAS